MFHLFVSSGFDTHPASTPGNALALIGNYLIELMTVKQKNAPAGSKAYRGGIEKETKTKPLDGEEITPLPRIARISQEI